MTFSMSPNNYFYQPTDKSRDSRAHHFAPIVPECARCPPSEPEQIHLQHLGVVNLPLL